MSHLFNGARRAYIAVHHRGVCGQEADPANTACFERKFANCNGEYKYFYDFCISRAGSVYTSHDDALGCEPVPFYQNPTGGATCGANCAAGSWGGVTAVMMQRCYGGTDCTCPLSGFTDPQLCGLAYVSLHLGAGTFFGQQPSTGNHISHLKAGAWLPCGSGECAICGANGSCATQCCGTNLAGPTPSGWTAEGEYEINRALWMRTNLAMGCSCTGEICA